MTNNLMVLFPGNRYTAAHPLLYYAHLKYERKGYQVIRINYGSFNTIDEAKSSALAQIKEIDFTIYDDIVFISKSMGTVIAGEIAETLSTSVRHVYLTPLEDTLRFIKYGENISIVIAGTKDPYMDAHILKEHCEQEKIKPELIEDADHSLEVSDDADINIDILKRIVDFY